ncbi:MAG TPA: hypothetical protein VML55_23040 [Planctomycetaceae bacterium]|nr:hypothetical protein [Planctomycetaceae bacterium]
MKLEHLVFCGGVLHFGILLASALVPKVLDWKSSLQRLDALSRQLVWVHGAFIVLVIVGFGTLSALFAAELAAGTPLARAVCGFIAVFWGARLLVQFFVFDAGPHMKTGWLRAGYHTLTLVFAYHVVVYSATALF